MIKKLKLAIDNSNNIVFFTGAGMSTASGIPDFRSSTGLYKTNLRAEEMISHHYFLSNTKEFFEFYKEKMIFIDAKPNYGHIYIANLEKNKNKKISVITQNIDNLHQIAGSKNVYELHGSVYRNYCMKCHKSYDIKKILNSKEIPLCEDCQGIIKPDVVLYEESLDQNVIEKSINVISKADLLIILGTSLNVYPAASFVRYFRGNTLAIINKEQTQADEYCDIIIHDDISNTFKKLDK